MKQALSIVLAASLALAPSSVRAAVEPVEAIPAGEDNIVSLRKGDPAPFSGQLFDQPTALRWGNYLEQYKFRLRLEEQSNKKVQDAQTAYYKSLLAAEQTKYVTVVTDLQKRLTSAEDALRDPPWYKTTWFGVVIGVASTAAVFSLSVWALEARK